MKKKIEKLDYVLIEGYDALKPERKGDVDYNCLAEKINEIIDYLNTQPQEEEKPVTVAYMGEEVVAGTDKSIKKHKKDMEDFIKGKSTPEQKEDWEEEFMEVLETFKDEVCSNFFASSKPLTNFIKQLLSEREMFTKDELFMLKLATNDIHNKGNGAYDEIGEKIGRMLSKLKSKE